MLLLIDLSVLSVAPGWSSGGGKRGGSINYGGISKRRKSDPLFLLSNDVNVLEETEGNIEAYLNTFASYE